jgi:hypothetical protein
LIWVLQDEFDDDSMSTLVFLLRELSICPSLVGGYDSLFFLFVYMLSIYRKIKALKYEQICFKTKHNIWQIFLPKIRVSTSAA